MKKRKPNVCLPYYEAMAIYQEGKTSNKYENFKASPPRKKPKEISARRYLEGRS